MAIILASQIGQVLTPDLAVLIARDICAAPDASIDVEKLGAARCGRLVFQAEYFRDIVNEMHVLHELHWLETEKYRHGQGLNPDYDYFIASERAGKMIQFTARADGALVGNAFAGELGDIVVDIGVASRSNVSNTIGFVEISTSASQRGAVGVLASLPKALDAQTPPAALRASRASFYQLDGSLETTDTPVPEFAALATTHKVAAMNSLGEGQINVCGEGGNLLIGDLIVTSSTQGKGMKQADDIIRSYTVAKCRENVTFSSPTEVKMVACIYLCG